MPIEKERAEAMKLALSRLSRRGYTGFEIDQYLQEKNISATIRKDVIEACAQYGYLLDDKWALGYAKAQASRKQGPAAIRRKLYEKGFSEETIETALDAVGEDAQRDAIERIIATRYRNRDLNDPQQRQKTIAALARKGYSYDVIRSILDE